MVQHTFPSFRNSQTLKRTRKRGHASIPPNSSSQEQLMGAPPTNIGRIAKGAAHNSTSTLRWIS